MFSSIFRLTGGQRDTVRALAMLVGYLVTAVVPRSLDGRIVSGLARLFHLLRPDSAPRLAGRMADTLGGDPSHLLDRARAHYRVRLEGVWGRLRSLHRSGWNPVTEIHGLETLEAARAAGRGTILWRISLCDTQVAKIALARVGIPPTHLSRAEHGAHSNAWAARHVLAPLYQRAENWHLRERVVMPWGGPPTEAKERLSTCLARENGVISIFGDLTGKHAVVTPFFAGQAAFARGAPSLATKTGAVLLPCYPVWERPGHYRLVIEDPIDLDPDSDRSANVARAVEEFSIRMQAAIRRHPESWMGWGQYWTRHPPFQDA
jgi:lauroyl/myristoyl acyltransferase